MKGFFNQFLKIDLGAGSFSYEPVSDEVLKRTLGGKGLGTFLLETGNPPGADPLGPENQFIIATGPATGTAMWGQARFGVYAKSPATGGFGESYCGGTMAPLIKGCGIDAVVITGRSPRLQFLVIDETGVRFEDAGEIKGAETPEAEAHILEHSPNGAAAMVIGPAGENLVAFACIKSNRWRSLGRCGMGAVLGSKNIKGISFFGKKKADVADPAGLTGLIKEVTQAGKEAPVTELYQKLGTPMQVKVANSIKFFPTRYWRGGYFDRWEKISADYMQEHFDVKARACPNCFLRCTKHSTVKHGRHKGLTLEGPEFETIYAIGGLNAVDSLEEIAWLNDICDRLGLDTMSAGNMTAFAVEAFEAGKTDFEIHYNQPEKMGALLHLIARREGLGSILARGIKSASEELNMEDTAVHVKGLEPAGFDPRVLKGMGLSYATSARGACHLRGTFYKAELSGHIDRDQIEGKAELVIDYEDRAALFDSLVLCRFFRDFLGWDRLMTLVAVTTGLTYSREELAVVANGITEATRGFNRREGLDDSTDKLPDWLLKPNAEGAAISEADLNTMLDQYNEIRRSRK